ncbi:hypothetical protein [Lutibacter sp.]|uniref:hypothetical protein n=1 Tax=Lutibacter sp. TaxID=1925666 RepID=UPI001A312107|nr:hypothetical protein [Lutibacter sp.]MBI9041956.1 hypothetical protein [Lutibacter sp.]
MKNSNSIKIVGKYTIMASLTGAFPVPASSAAIVGQNAIMVNHIGNVYGLKITKWTLLKSIGLLGSVNMVGRNLFIEGAKLLSWGTGSVWAAPALCLFGAATAGLQTYILGMLAIEIAKQGGSVLDFTQSSEVISMAKNNYDDFVKEWKGKDFQMPSQN